MVPSGFAEFSLLKWHLAFPFRNHLRAERRQLFAGKRRERGIVGRFQIALEQIDCGFIFGNLRSVEAFDVSRAVRIFRLDEARA
jgi:hypothetical protein